MIVLDASVTVSWLLGEPNSTEELNEYMATRRIVVPSHWISEVGHAILKALHRKSIPQQQLVDIATDLEVLNVIVEPPPSLSSIVPMIGFAQQSGLTMYDAAYVQLALARNAELATFDRAMRQTATRLGISLFPAS